MSIKGNDKDEHLRGAGDVVEWVMEKSGIKYLVKRVYGQCDCQKRKNKLNELLPFNPKSNYTETVTQLKNE